MIVKAKINSNMEMAMNIEKPRPLAAKKCNDIFSAACDHCPLLKLAGRKGISVSVYLQDGLFAAPFGKIMMARHNLFFKPQFCPLTFDTPLTVSCVSCKIGFWSGVALHTLAAEL